MGWRLASAFLAMLVVPAAAAAAPDAVLVMFEKPGCAWCAAWERDVGRVYDRTEEGKLLPLRRVGLGQELPDELAGLKPVAFTPTFVVTQCGQEVGRIIGYPGEAHFYGLLNEIIADLRRHGEDHC